MKIVDYELTYDISCLFEKKIFIYGTGVYGNKVASVFSQMGITIEGFCETDPREKEIFSVKSLIENYDESGVLVILASEGHYKEMLNQLRPAKNMNICTYYALFISLYLNDGMERIAEEFRNNIQFFKKISIDKTAGTFWGLEWVGYYEVLSKPSSVWIYQPGKMGSESIYWSAPLKTCHFHSLARAFNEDSGMSDICSEMITKFKEKPIRIITGVREPIARDLSLFFQATETNTMWPLIFYGQCTIYLYGDYSRGDKLDTQILKKRICTFEKSLNDSFEHLGKEIVEHKSDEFSWFDYEIKALFGVDIYQYPFDKEKGYAIIKQDNMQILLYKCEKLNQLESVIGEFLDEPGFKLKKANQADEKVYANVYRGFKEDVKLNKQYFDYYYEDNPKLKHFYTDAEVEQFKARWGKKLQKG